MSVTAIDWRQTTRERAIAEFRQAWERAPEAGRAALIEAARHGGPGHRWETGRRACVLALLVTPALRPHESPKMAAYRLFGCEVVDDFPVTWDAGGVSLAELLASVGVHVPDAPRGGTRRLLPARPARAAAQGAAV
jgi:hypothetical protein